MKNIFIILLLSFAAMTAQAQDTRSEFFYQAGADEMFVQGNLNHSDLTQDATIPGFKMEFPDTNLDAAFEMGLSETYSVYGNLGYGSGKFKATGGTDGEFKGLNPINLGAKINHAVGSGTLFGKANLGLGLLGKQDCDSMDCNRTDNSINLSLRVGYLLSLEKSFAGLALDFGLFSTDGKKENGDEFDKKGAFVITAFYEAIISDMILGGALVYSRASILNSTITGPFYDPDALPDSETSYVTLKAYTRAPISETMSVLGSLSYDVSIDQSNDSFDGGSGFGANLGLRVSL